MLWTGDDTINHDNYGDTYHHHHGPGDNDILIHNHDGGRPDHNHYVCCDLYDDGVEYGPAVHDHDHDDTDTAHDRPNESDPLRLSWHGSPVNRRLHPRSKQG
ncbi:unnamed protein product [marine sediment metagenome]|uniref:Uncharacterized protein n=1 Tax=marine sediment metagenome TaxID=412755 RepID=X0SJX9_9ZZZZ